MTSRQPRQSVFPLQEPDAARQRQLEFVTREELAGFATKDDLLDLATPRSVRSLEQSIAKDTKEMLEGLVEAIIDARVAIIKEVKDVKAVAEAEKEVDEEEDVDEEEKEGSWSFGSTGSALVIGVVGVLGFWVARSVMKSP